MASHARADDSDDHRAGVVVSATTRGAVAMSGLGRTV